MADGNPKDPIKTARPAGPGESPLHQPRDKSAKLLYRDKQIVAEFLNKHVLGKIVPDEIAAGIDLDGLQPGPTEHVDPKLRTVRHADLVWRAPFRDSWFYVVFLFEFQATPDWRMPVRILLETALAYDYLSRGEPASKARKLPPALPIVVHVGTRPWPGSTRLEDLLADEAQAFLPLALGQESLLVWEAEEARELGRPETAREAALKLRYAADEGEYREALALLAALLPPDGKASEGLAAWVRSSMIEAGAKEEDVARVRQLQDLAEPVVDSWFAKKFRESARKGLEAGLREGREEGRREAEARARRDLRATIERLARRKFGGETASALATLLEGVSGSGRLAEVADLIIDCRSGPELLARTAKTS